MSLYNELKRRNVFRVAIAYLALAWLVTEVAGTLFPAFGIPDWGVRFIVIVFALGLVPALIISWVYELTPEGLKREKDVVHDASITHLTAKRLDVFTIGLIVVAFAFILTDRFWLSPRHAEQSAFPAAVVTDTVQTAGTEPAEPQYPPNSIAVLPFVNMSDDAANEYFSDGISEELLNLLAKIPELRVIARTSSFAYKGKDVNIADMANELKVGHILEGSVRKAGNQVRITAQLIRASDSSHLWSETYDRTLDNIFAIQDEIAAAVVRQLKIKLLGETPKAHVVDPEAYALFLQAIHFSDQGTIAGNQQADEFLQQALAIDPAYSAAWSELGSNYGNKIELGLVSQKEGYPLALEAQSKALELDPGNAAAYSRLGWDRLIYEGDLAAAARLFEQALALEPGNAIVLANTAALALTLGRSEQAVTLGKLALQRNPLSPTSAFNLGRAYLTNGQNDKAEAMFRKTLLLSPARPAAQGALARALYRKGDKDDFEETMSLIEAEPVEPMRLAASAAFHYCLGNSAESDAALDTLIEEYPQFRTLIALTYAMRDETDKAFKWLREAVELGGPLALMNVWYAPEFEVLHADPRWERMLNSVGRSKKQLATIKFEFTLPEQEQSLQSPVSAEKEKNGG
jgi:TolB-like protein/Tfp pilus assembly protein PilF